MNLKDLMKNKKFVNLSAVLLIGIIVIIFSGNFTDKKLENKETSLSAEDEIERRLEEILSTVKGAGKVSVFVVLEDYGTNTLAKDLKERENDREEKTVIADNMPIITTARSPTVKGVIISAQGANSEGMREKLKSAVETALGVMPHRVEILVHK